MQLKRKKISRDTRTQAEKDRDSRLKKKRVWVDCDSCFGDDGAWVDGTIVAVTCARCMQIACGPPEETVVPTRKYAGFDFPRGWWRKITFSGEHDGKTRYYTRGNEITRAEYKKLVREHG